MLDQENNPIKSQSTWEYVQEQRETDPWYGVGLSVLVSRTECDYCGEWYLDHRAKCEHCGTNNPDYDPKWSWNNGLGVDRPDYYCD